LLAAIKEYEASKWKVIGQKVGKPAKVSSHIMAYSQESRTDLADLQACEQFAKEHFSKT